MPRIPIWLAAGTGRGRLSLFGLVTWLGLGAACVSDSGRSHSSPRPVRDSVEGIHLFGAPVALDFDQKPGSDGFAVQVYASGRSRPGAIPIRSGTIEIAMFDGMVSQWDDASPKPKRSWTFSAKELVSHASLSALGTGYRFALRWEEAAPTQSRITIYARYISPKKEIILSHPNTVSVGPR